MDQSLFPSGGTFAPLLFAAGAGLLIAMLLRRSSRRLGKRGRGKNQPVGSAFSTAKPAEAAASSVRADRSAVELHDLARDLMGQLDSKMILLQELVAQSDRQIARLEELLDAAEKNETTDEHR